jgi:crotonobetainyl-CoA:carnitine CoA-transferase CaiB-like acyl-CoA transferase
MMMADMGASVIKVEKTLTGDDTRSWGPPFLDQKDGYQKEFTSHSQCLSTYFLSVNRNKKSLAVDMKTEKGQNICHRLAVEWADVIVENFKVGTMDRFGLDFDSLRKQSPGLIYCSITGFGPSGPLCEKPGYDAIVSGMYGLMSITGPEHGDPVKVGVAITDVLTGTLAQAGILAALHERNKTGIGQKIDTSLMETQLVSLVNIASSSLNAPPGSPPPKRWGTAHESVVPYQAFRCKQVQDRPTEYIVAGAGNNEQFQQFCIALELPELAADTRFSTNSDRVANRQHLIPFLKAKFLEKPRDEWMLLLSGKSFPFGPIRTIPESFQCEQAQHRQMVMEMNHPVVGPVKFPGFPLKFSDVSSDQQNDVTNVSSAPMLGKKILQRF